MWRVRGMFGSRGRNPTFPLIPVKCRLDVSWNLHQCLVIVISAAARHYGDSLPSSGNCQGIFWCV